MSFIQEEIKLNAITEEEKVWCIKNYDIFSSVNKRDVHLLTTSFSEPIGMIYVGMGHWMSLHKLKDCDEDKKYYFAELGGSNGYEDRDNMKKFKNNTIDLLCKSSKLYTFSEVIQIIKNDEL